jgi:hypothetical protein
LGERAVSDGPSRRTDAATGVGREHDRLPVCVGCLDTASIPMTLVSTSGFHCEVWQSMGYINRGGRRELVDFVLKRHLEPCSLAQTRIYRRDYGLLREALGDVVPEASFVATRIDGTENIIVLARTCSPWFDIANPGNEEETIALVRANPPAARALRRFVSAARAWAGASTPRVIDLFGRENLVLDRSPALRYLDSFGVFYYPDVLDVVAEPDPMLAHRIEVSLARLAYLETIAAAVET